MLARFPRWTVDDAFISYRYAANLATHGELNWNVGEDPVEGYTGVGLPVLVAGALRLGAPAVGFARVLGVVAFAAAGLALAGALRELDLRREVRALAVASFATAPAAFVHATSGLETMPFVAAVAASLWALLVCLRTDEPSARHERVLAAALLATSLLRPEGAVVTLAFALTLAAWRAGRASARAAVESSRRIALLFGVPAAAYFAWRAHYYGRWLPNTWYAKAHPGLSDDWAMSAIRFAGHHLAALLALGLGLGLVGRTLGARLELSAKLRHAAVACVAVIGACGVQYSQAEMIQDYAWRFAFHVYPLALVLAAALLSAALACAPVLSGVGSTARNALAAAGLAVALAGIGAQIRETDARARWCERYRRLLSDEHAPIAAWIKGHVPASEWIACHVDAGVIAFASERKTLDLGRLNDETLARPGVDEKAVADRFFDVAPAVLVMSSASAERPVGPQSSQAILDDPRFARWRLERVWTSSAPDVIGCQFVFVRRDVVLAS